MPKLRKVFYKSRGWNVSRGIMRKTETVRLLEVLEDVARLDHIENKTFIEIGTARGETARGIVEFLTNLKCRSRLYSFDIVDRTRLWQRYFGKTSTRYCEARHVVMSGVDGASRIAYPPESVVFVLVDGCHCRECVAADIEAWAPLIVPGGFFLFHDYAESEKEIAAVGPQPYHGEDRFCGVKEAVDECLPENFERLGRRFSLFTAKRKT
ncbi:MAG: class I SAM-dependent methyltransferase [Candidatus Latescibacterota bacterium]|nr:MAG: class I SAM-dependent methyltransferase [Candidatus Latescibacterota bacterium]